MTSLANEELSLAVDADYGARITSLLDKRTGREWMVQGARSADTGRDAVYGAAEAIGWDECFPTVAPWNAERTAWGGRLRDHGELWGRPAEIAERTRTSITTIAEGELFSLRRRLELEQTTLRVRYRLDNRAGETLPYLWAAHGLLQVTPRDRILLPGRERVTATYLGREGKPMLASSLDWPGPNPAWPEALEAVQPASAHIAAKLYVENWPAGAAFVGNGQEGWLRIGWSKEIDSLGVWLNYGGWPVPGDTHHIGLEPTNSPVDHLGDAIARGAPPLPPGGGREWFVEYTLRADAPETT